MLPRIPQAVNSVPEIPGFHDLELVGEGGYSLLWKAKRDNSEEIVALKTVSKNLAPPSILAGVHRSVELQNNVPHRNIVQIFGTSDTERFVCVAQEFADGGDLLSYVNQHGRMSEGVTRDFIRQLMSAIVVMHSAGMVHRDIKPDNVCLTTDGVVKLCDFDMASMLDSSGYVVGSCGSPQYAAPEVFSGHRYLGRPADVWSCGVTLYSMLCQSLPFNGMNPQILSRQTQRGDFLMPYFFSENVQKLLRGMMKPNADLRLTAEQVLAHPWMAQQ